MTAALANHRHGVTHAEHRYQDVGSPAVFRPPVVLDARSGGGVCSEVHCEASKYREAPPSSVTVPFTSPWPLTSLMQHREGSRPARHLGTLRLIHDSSYETGHLEITDSGTHPVLRILSASDS